LDKTTDSLDNNLKT